MNSNIKEMAKFYIPLAATSVLMMTSHSIVSAGLARTAEANAALAAYAVAQSLAVMFEGPCYSMQRMCISLFKDQTSFHAVKKVMFGFWAILSSIMLIIAFTPVGHWVFTRLLNVPPNIFPDTIRAFRVFLILPAASALRSFYQGVIVVNRRTTLLTINMALRLTVMLMLSLLLPRIESLPGSMVGALVMGFGMSTEALLAFLTGKSLARNLPEENPAGPPTNVMGAIKFYLPIMLATVAWTFTRPILNGALARTANPEFALASYQVAWSFSFIFTAVVFNIHQLAIIFGQEPQQRKLTLRFAMAIGFGGSLLLGVVTFTPLGPALLTTAIGASAELANEAIKVIAIFSLLPMVSAIIEFSNGVLMIAGQTRYLTVGKLINIVVLTVTTTVIAGFFPHIGGQLAAIAMVSGAVVESAFLATLSVKPYRTHGIMHTPVTDLQ